MIQVKGLTPAQNKLLNNWFAGLKADDLFFNYEFIRLVDGLLTHNAKREKLLHQNGN